jgi:hypothetical protein
MNRFFTRGKTIEEIQLALTQNLPITSVDDDIIEGCVSKPKGIKQVLSGACWGRN